MWRLLWVPLLMAGCVVSRIGVSRTDDGARVECNGRVVEIDSHSGIITIYRGIDAWKGIVRENITVNGLLLSIEEDRIIVGGIEHPIAAGERIRLTMEGKLLK